MPILDESLTLNREVFAWCVRQTAKWVKKEPERAALWCSLAAHTATLYGCSQLASPELESHLARLGKRLAEPRHHPQQSRGRHWLHVFSMVYPIGGHTALAERWINWDESSDRHSAIFTSQEISDIAPRLAEAIQRKNGWVKSLNNPASLLTRAQQLRDIAWQEADVVVLHTHMWDVLPTLAFCLPGGPPIILLNHADHCFWVGGSVSDLTVSIRKSGRLMAEEFRGLKTHAELPVPLPDFLVSPDLEQAKYHKKTQALTRLGLNPSWTIFLTIGSAFKYEPTEDANFFAAAQAILERLPESCLIAVGPTPKNEHWQALFDNTRGRAIAVGQQIDLRPFHLAADIYLEGFPFGSLTALLEAGLAGLASVRAPQVCPAPYVADGIALEVGPRPIDSQAYINLAIQLAENKASRGALAAALSASIARYHCGPGWLAHLNKLKSEIPVTHRGYTPFSAKTLDSRRNTFWHRLLMQAASENPVNYVFAEAEHHNLRPALDSKLWKAIQRAKSYPVAGESK